MGLTSGQYSAMRSVARIAGAGKAMRWRIAVVALVPLVGCGMRADVALSTPGAGDAPPQPSPTASAVSPLSAQTEPETEAPPRRSRLTNDPEPVRSPSEGDVSMDGAAPPPPGEPGDASGSDAVALTRICSWPDFPAGRKPAPDDVVEDINAYGAQHPDEWAGFWQWGDHIRVAVTANLPAHERRLADVLRDRHPFRVFEATWSLRQLNAAHKDAAAFMHERHTVAGARVQAVSTDVVNNVVAVMIEHVDDDVRAEMARRFGVEKYCVEEGSMNPAGRERPRSAQ